MNIAVCVKPVPDPGHYNRITINPETKLLDRKGIPVIINPVDKNAIEAALQLKEQFGKSCPGQHGSAGYRGNT